MPSLLLEIGTEELPASFQRPLATELEQRLRQLLSEHRIPAGPSQIFHAPRRLAVRFADVAAEKSAAEIEVQGPPRKAAFAADGSPTKTAIGFARAQGKEPADLYTKETPRGEYVFVRKLLPAVPTPAILQSELPGLIAGLPLPKSMRWTPTNLSFARPIRWLVCLLGNQPVPFSLDGITAGSTTFGHRNFTTGPIPVSDADQYEAVLTAWRVIPNPEARRQRILAELNRLSAEVNGTVVLDDELLEETIGVTEYPEPIRCSFAPDYLDIPEEVLITAFKKHQRCFAIRRQDGAGLLPSFIAVTNTPGCNKQLVTTWYEKAVESRLRDARFFFQTDLKLGLAPLVEEEKRVVWIEGMGSYFDKTERLRRLCRCLASAVPNADPAALDRAALLAKTDLLTNMVREKEFTSLQGRIGGIYARLLGESETVATAIAEQYLPNYIGDELPKTRTGALLAVADKIDNIVATFLTGNIPTGSEDPFALRRQATGLLLIIIEHELPINLDELLQTGISLFPNHNQEYASALPPFFRERVASLIADSGIAYDIAAAVLETAWTEPVLAIARARALAAYRSRPEFERLIVGQKRVANILRKEEVTGQPDPARFTEPAERQLWDQAQAAEPELVVALDNHDYEKAFGLLLELRPTIDRFFDEVLVMDNDQAIRTNRLQLLSYVRSLFGRVADLSRIVIDGE